MNKGSYPKARGYAVGDSPPLCIPTGSSTVSGIILKVIEWDQVPCGEVWVVDEALARKIQEWRLLESLGK